MKLLFIGDIVGSPGRKAVRELVPRLRAELGLGAVVANGENSAGGSGITPKTASEIFDSGVDIITSGDHLWDQKEVLELLKNEARFIRPLNYPVNNPGKGFTTIPLPEGGILGVANVQCRTFMQALENPFVAIDGAVSELRQSTPIILVDVHGEATSEKIALGRFLDGRVSAVIGTHTHVQTADEQIFPGGTAFLCDAGFTGPQESILGREIAPIIERFLTNQPRRFAVATGNIVLKGAVVEIDSSTGRARSIERVSVPLTSDDT
ncbi:MAG: TIGR00282 family metallophosphoesterase [Verrucomicrobiae bacterium]|jgi:metallophosphoesterase (TIGR00282 family)|nr:TIGR00282 family metallophosphoesterase [Verrucomicrobiae bacterium]